MADQGPSVVVAESVAKQLLGAVQKGRSRSKMWRPPEVPQCGIKLYYRFIDGRLVIDDIRCEGGCHNAECRWHVVHNEDNDAGYIDCACLRKVSGTGGGPKHT